MDALRCMISNQVNVITSYGYYLQRFYCLYVNCLKKEVSPLAKKQLVHYSIFIVFRQTNKNVVQALHNVEAWR